jgi:hypothetical protein
MSADLRSLRRLSYVDRVPVRWSNTVGGLFYFVLSFCLATRY